MTHANCTINHHPLLHYILGSGRESRGLASTSILPDRFLFDCRRTPQTTTGKSPMEVLNQRKMKKSRLDLLHLSLQGKFHKKQTQTKETHHRKGHERTFIPGESVYVKNFGPGLKWLIGTILHVTGPVSYTVALQDGRVSKTRRSPSIASCGHRFNDSCMSERCGPGH